MTTIEIAALVGAIILGSYLVMTYLDNKRPRNMDIMDIEKLKKRYVKDDGIKQLYSLDLEDRMAVTNNFYNSPP